MFRSPADKMFLKRMALIIVIAEFVVIGASYVIFGDPYWLVMAIMGGAAVFAAIIGFSALFGPDYNTFSPWPSSMPRPLPPRRGSVYPGYGPHGDPRERMVRQSEADQRMARDESVAMWLGLAEPDRRGKSEPTPRGQAHLIWSLGPLVAVVLVVALLVWGGAQSAN